MASKKKFNELGNGEMFTALGERYIKISPLSYRSLDNPTLGEQPYGPILDKQMWVEPKQVTVTKPTITADPETLETAAALNTTPKKTAKKTPKKKAK